MNDSGTHNFDEQDGADAQADLRLLGEALDRNGARERSTLSSAALERIFAASELQLPLGDSAVTPGAPRLQLVAPQQSFLRKHAPFVRYAAAAAIVIATGALVVVLSRSAHSPDGSGTRELANGNPEKSMAPVPTVPERNNLIVLQPPTVEHLDSAMVAMSTSPVVLSVSLPTLAHSLYASGDFDAQVHTSIHSGIDSGIDSGLDAYQDVSFEELSSEFAAIVKDAAYRP